MYLSDASAGFKAFFLLRNLCRCVLLICDLLLIQMLYFYISFKTNHISIVLLYLFCALFALKTYFFTFVQNVFCWTNELVCERIYSDKWINHDSMLHWKVCFICASVCSAFFKMPIDWSPQAVFYVFFNYVYLIEHSLD